MIYKFDNGRGMTQFGILPETIEAGEEELSCFSARIVRGSPLAVERPELADTEVQFIRHNEDGPAFVLSGEEYMREELWYSFGVAQ